MEEIIGSVSDKIEVILNIDKTHHAQDRQSRHDDKFISDSIIKSALDDAVKEIAMNLILDNININQRLLIINHKYDPPLNIVGVINKIGQKLKFVVITIMYTNQFRNTKHTKILEIN